MISLSSLVRRHVFPPFPTLSSLCVLLELENSRARSPLSVSCLRVMLYPAGRGMPGDAHDLVRAASDLREPVGRGLAQAMQHTVTR